MSAAFHRCQSCGYEIVITNTLGVFEDNRHCPQCGLSASESDMKMQDELSSLMAHNLHLTSTIPQRSTSSSMPPTPQVLPASVPITYVSQHYHHSGHLLRPNSSVSTHLENAGVEASVLLPSQLQLFRNAAPDQQLRLIELWRIAPPTYGNQMLAKDPGNWPQTSMQQEEQAARNRYEAQERLHYKNLGVSYAISTNAEPYIVNGYGHQAGSKTISSDGDMASMMQEDCENTSINQRSREWWRFSASQPMEHQYGLLQHMQMYGQQLDQSDVTNDRDEEML